MRSEKGAITLYVSIVCLFILIVGVIAYIGASNKQAVQMAELNKIEEQYKNPEVTEQDLYENYDGGDIVPIYTPEQFAKVGSGEEVYVAETGKFYTFSVDKTYMFYGVPEDFDALLVQLKDEIKVELGTGGSTEVMTIAGIVSVYEGADNELSKYFMCSENAEDPVTSVIYTDNCHSDTVVTNTKDLDIGNHTIKCTITKQSTKTASGIKNITVKDTGLAKENTIIKPSASSNVQIVIPKGFAPVILEGSNSTTSLPGQSGKVKSIIPKDQWNSITIEQINQGIVIVDHLITYDNGQTTGTVPDFNEFVWVPIPDSDDFDRTAWTTIGTSTTPQTLAETSTSSAYWDDKTTTEYTNMVSSVEQHKGFYIGRYEASVNGTIAQSKRGQTPKENISQTDSITACTSNTAILNMHLMYGIEWDSTLNWLKGKATIASSTAGATKTMALEDIQTNSNTWGNYYDSTGDAANTPYVQETKQNTGASEYWKANNIYDLAGNVDEWTQEKYSTGYSRTIRGGDYGYSGGSCPAAVRGYSNASNTNSYLRFQSQLLLVALTSGMKNYSK